MGLKDESNVCTTNFKPGARLITLRGRKERNKRNTRRIPKILGLDSLITLISKSIIEMITSDPSIMFQPEVK